MAGRPVLLASRSEGKLVELRPLFEEAGIPVIDLRAARVPVSSAEDAVEAFDSFEENAIAKARYFSRLTGMPAVADDSGLEVLALGGAPGVRSRRWSGREDLDGAALDAENNRLLMERLRGMSDRRARYVCVAAFAAAGFEVAERGQVAGTLLESPRGSGGFGYDPYFVPQEAIGADAGSAGAGVRTFAELGREEKSRISHRGRAFRKLIARLVSAGVRD